jgi:hypothetical protein
MSAADRSAMRAEYLRSPHGTYFRGGNSVMLTGMVRHGLPYPVFAGLHDAFARWDDPAVLHGRGPYVLVVELAEVVRAGRLGWDELPGWVRYDVPGTRQLLGYRNPSEDDGRPARDRWAEWHPAYVAMGPGAPHPGLWRAAGFGPEEATRLCARGQVPDTATLEAMAALRRDPRDLDRA